MLICTVTLQKETKEVHFSSQKNKNNLDKQTYFSTTN